MNTIETGWCPFKKLNNQIQQTTKNNICQAMRQNQAIKHKEYVDIIRLSFEFHKDYYINIQKHITPEDIDQCWSIDNHDTRIQFINTKLKEYFWKGIVFHKDLTMRELSLQKIGNLWLDDVTSILHSLLKQDILLEGLLLRMDTEILLRLKNNVLIDSIVHLKDFPDSLISADPEQSAQLVLSIMENNFIQFQNRFSPTIIPEEFVEPMKNDNMIDKWGVIPQVTFGCPIVNVEQGSVFRIFIREFMRCFVLGIYINNIVR